MRRYSALPQVYVRCIRVYANVVASLRNLKKPRGLRLCFTIIIIVIIIISIIIIITIIYENPQLVVQLPPQSTTHTTESFFPSH